MSHDDFPSAAIARLNSTSRSNARVSAALSEVLKRIESTTVAGGTMFSYDDHGWSATVEASVTQFLKEKGYQVNAGDSQLGGKWFQVWW